MKKIFKLIQSPFKPPMEVIGNLVINLHVPYSDKEVTIQINPNYQEYVENQKGEGIEIKQFSVTTTTIDTMQFSFDFGENKSKTFNYDDETYTLTLHNIGTEKIDGQDFRFFEFEAEWDNTSERTGGAIDFQIVPKINQNNPTQFILDIGDVNNLNSKRLSILIDKDFDLIFRLVDLDGKVVELRNKRGNLWKAEDGFRVIFSWNNKLIKHKLVNVNTGKSQDIEKELKEIKTFHMWEKPPMIIGANLNKKQNAKMDFNELKIFSKPII